MPFDLAIVETGNGGDLTMDGADLGIVTGIENQVYLGTFGGNPGYPTPGEDTAEQSFDWWGNGLLLSEDENNQFNSSFEAAIATIPLTSAGRQQLEGILKADVAFLSDDAQIDTSVTIVATDRINVSITMKLTDGSTKIKVINFRKTTDGDFSITDFNDDFFL